MKKMQVALIAAAIGAAAIVGGAVGVSAGPVGGGNLGGQVSRFGSCMTGFSGSPVLQGAYVCASPPPACGGGYHEYDARLEAGVFKFNCVLQPIPG